MFWVDEISSFQFALLDTAWDILTVSFFHIFILFSKSNSALHPLTFRRYGHMLRCSPHESVKLRSVFSFRSAQSFSRKAAAIYTPVTVRSVSAPFRLIYWRKDVRSVPLRVRSVVGLTPSAKPAHCTSTSLHSSPPPFAFGKAEPSVPIRLRLHAL